MREFPLTQEAVSKKVGRERSAVANSPRLLTLPAEAEDEDQKADIMFYQHRLAGDKSTRQRASEAYRPLYDRTPKIVCRHAPKELGYKPITADLR